MCAHLLGDFLVGSLLRVAILVGEGVIDLFMKCGDMSCFLGDREGGSEEEGPLFH